MHRPLLRRTKVRHMTSMLSVAVLSLLLVLTFAAPASAQVLVDASEDGGLAFIAFAVMCFIFVAFLFAIDRIRQRHDDE